MWSNSKFANKRKAPQMIYINACCQEIYGPYDVDTTVDFLASRTSSIIKVDTTNNPVEITFGDNTNKQQTIYVVDVGGNAGTNALTINGNTHTINGAGTRVLNTDYQASSLMRNGATDFAATDTIQAGGGGADGNAEGALIDVTLTKLFTALNADIPNAGDLEITNADLLAATPSVIVSAGEFYVNGAVLAENRRVIDTLSVQYKYDDATDPAETFIGGLDIPNIGTNLNEVRLYPLPVDGASTTLLQMIDKDDAGLTASSLENLQMNGNINGLYTGGLGINPPHAPANVGKVYSDYVTYEVFYDGINTLFVQSETHISHS